MNSFLTFAQNKHPYVYKLICDSINEDFTFPIPPKSFTAHLLGLVLGQRIAFKSARTLRKKLYTVMNGVQFSSQDVWLSKGLLIVSLGQKTWDKLEPYIDIQSIDGITGEWTKNGMKLLLWAESPDQTTPFIPLWSDKWIQQNAQIILGLGSPQDWTRRIVQDWGDYANFLMFMMWKLPLFKTVQSKT